MIRPIEALLNLLWPRGANCLVCGDPRRADPETGVCPACMEELERERVPSTACHRCLSNTYHSRGCPFCAGGGMKGLDQAFAPLRYRPASRKLTMSVKFHATNEAVPLLSRWMSESLWDRSFDCIVPVPLHPDRLRERGANQAALLAQGVSERTGIPVREDILERVRYTQPQTSLDRKKRAGNVRRAFKCKAGTDLNGKRVLIVDDVRTSGATARACAQALRDAGCTGVCLLTACCTSSGNRRMRGKAARTFINQSK